MRLEETVETLAKQHIQLEQACEIEKVKSKTKGAAIPASPTSPTIIKGFRIDDDEDSEDEDLFEDAMSDFPEAFPGITSPEKEDNKYLNPYTEFEDSMSLNDDSSITSGELSIQVKSGSSILNTESDIRRSHSEQELNATNKAHHKRWQSEDINVDKFKQVMNISYFVCHYMLPNSDFECLGDL